MSDSSNEGSFQFYFMADELAAMGRPTCHPVMRELRIIIIMLTRHLHLEEYVHTQVHTIICWFWFYATK